MRIHISTLASSIQSRREYFAIMAKLNLKTLAYNSIRHKIITCEYAPGMFLNEEMLTSALALSRTPVRDALSRLEQEGLVTIHPKRGITVTPLNFSDINMIFELRSLYEPYILQNYGKLLPPDKLNNYYSIFMNPPKDNRQHIDGLSSFQLDAEFHAMIVNVCPNRYLQQSYRSTQTQNERFRHMTGIKYDQRLAETFQEHLNIVRCCLEQNWSAAAEQMRLHIEASRKSTFSLAFESLNKFAASLP